MTPLAPTAPPQRRVHWPLVTMDTQSNTLNNLLLYSTLLYSPLLYSTLLYSTLLYYTILYYTILY